LSVGDLTSELLCCLFGFGPFLGIGLWQDVTAVYVAALGLEQRCSDTQAQASCTAGDNDSLAGKREEIESGDLGKGCTVQRRCESLSDARCSISLPGP
jgi:hypothetical protein